MRGGSKEKKRGGCVHAIYGVGGREGGRKEGREGGREGGKAVIVVILILIVVIRTKHGV